MLLTRFDCVPKLDVAQVSSAKRRRCQRPAGEQETSREAIAEIVLGHFYAGMFQHAPAAGAEKRPSTASRLLGLLDVPLVRLRRPPCALLVSEPFSAPSLRSMLKHAGFA